METIYFLFGEGKELNMLQMAMRAVAMFVIALLLIRLSGRRSFGLRMPFDNVITILLGAVLSRGVAGSSPFWPTVAAGVTLGLSHRFVAWLAIKNDAFGRLVKGEAHTLFKDGVFIQKHMDEFQICEKDILEEVRIKANLDDLDKIKEVCVERNGELSVVKKET